MGVIMNSALIDLLQAIGYFLIGSTFGVLLAVIYMIRTGGF